jgi:hypothetical protein
LGSTGGGWRSVRLTGFLLALALGNGPSSVLHNEEHRRSLIGGSPRWSKADSAVGNLFALFLEHSIRKREEFCQGHGSQNFFEVVSADLVSWKKLGVQFAGRFGKDGPDRTAAPCLGTGRLSDRMDALELSRHSCPNCRVMMKAIWPKRIDCGRAWVKSCNSQKTGFSKGKVG